LRIHLEGNHAETDCIIPFPLIPGPKSPDKFLKSGSIIFAFQGQRPDHWISPAVFFSLWFANIGSCHNISVLQVFQNSLSIPNEPDIQLCFLLKIKLGAHNVSVVNPVTDFSVRNNSDPVQIKK